MRKPNPARDYGSLTYDSLPTIATSQLTAEERANVRANLNRHGADDLTAMLLGDDPTPNSRTYQPAPNRPRVRMGAPA